MTDKATLKEIEARIAKVDRCKFESVSWRTADLLLEICREQAARIKQLEKQIADDNELSKKQYGY